MSRTYDRNGKKYVSVTTFLSIINKPFLNNWRAKLGEEASNKIATEAADTGSRFHFLVDQINTGKMRWDSNSFQNQLESEADDVKGMMRAWQSWWNEHGFANQLVCSEKIVYSDIFGYAGQLDCELVDRVLDWKTSAGIYPDYFLQVHCYAFAKAEMDFRDRFPNHGFPYVRWDSFDMSYLKDLIQPKPIQIFNVDKLPPHKMRIKPKDGQLVFDWSLFFTAMCALRLWRWQNPNVEGRDDTTRDT